MATAARGDDQRRRYGQRRRGPCAVFHAYLHWASTPQRLASHSSWVDPQVMPGGLYGERDTRLSGLLVAESEPDHDGITSLPDRHPGFSPGVLVPFYKEARAYRLSAACGEVLSDAEPLPLGAGTPGKSRMTVSPPPGVSVSRAVPPFEVTRRCTMARPSPVPFGFEVVNRKKARSRSSALMPGPSSATVTCAPAVVTAAVTVIWPPALSASSALAIRLSRTCSRWPSPIQASTDAGARALPTAGASSVMPRSSATGCHATTRSLATSATSTAVGTGTTFSARATASRPSTSRDSLASSSSAPASSCPVAGSVSAASRSSRSRRAASGVRS